MSTTRDTVIAISRGGRQIRPTEKMAQYLEQNPIQELKKKQIELELLKTKLEITQIEQQIENMSLELTKKQRQNTSGSAATLKNEQSAREIGYHPDNKDNVEVVSNERSVHERSNAHKEAHDNAQLENTLAAPSVSKHVSFAPQPSLVQTLNRDARVGNMMYQSDHVSANCSREFTEFRSPGEPQYASTPARNASFDTGSQWVHYDHSPALLASEREHTSLTGSEALTDTFRQLVDMLADKQDKLPKMEPEVFDGDIMKYPIWLKSFEALIERHTKSSQDRLYYLSKYTSGEAKTAISGYLTLDSPDTYVKAKQALGLRFGDKFKLAETFKKRLKDWPIIKPNDGPALQKFADFLQHCDAAMSTISFLKILDNPDENREIVKKLPRGLADRWSRTVDRYLHDPANGNRDDSMYPTFAVFSEFLQKEARIACGPGALPSGQTPTNTRQRRGDATSFASSANEITQTVKENTRQAAAVTPCPSSTHTPRCSLCGNEHYLSQCDKFRSMNLEERKSHCGAKGLCFGCLRRGHIRADCKRTGRPLLFVGLPPKTNLSSNKPPVSDPRPRTNNTPEITVEASCQRVDVDITDETAMHSMIVPVTIYHISDPSRKIRTYALLDNQSNSCFATEALADELGAPTQAVNLKLTTMLETQSVTSRVVHGLVIQGIGEEQEVEMPATYTRDCIPADKALVPRQETALKWPHLQDIAEKLQPYDDNLSIGLLIGFNCTAALLPQEIVASGIKDPYGMRTPLGWGIIGVMNDTGTSRDATKFAFRTHAREIAPAQIKEMYELEFTESNKGRAYSVEDVKFIDIMKQGLRQRDDGHYELPLPFKSSKVVLPNNRHMALRRFQGLKTRLLRDENYCRDYKKFMQELIDKGHAERVPEDELFNKEVWYIPHHGVYHPNKPGKLRVVFDCSAEYTGDSLNKLLLQGPDQMNSLIGVLCRFRKEKVAFVCDIEGMFHQVSVRREDRNYLRFFWSHDITAEPVEYRMTVHLFGATSSPGCASYALRAAAEDLDSEHGEKAARFIKRGFYVDDGLASTATIEEATALIQNTIELCKKGGFKLHKFISTHREILNTIPMQYKAKDVQSLDLSCSRLPMSRTLGIEWCAELDVFRFNVQVKENGATRRSILSTVSSIFDPLGLVSPFLLTGRNILQAICRDGCTWDDPISAELEHKWLKWKAELPRLSELNIRRCFKPAEAAREARVELHHFSDASEIGYGQCSYLRIVDAEGNVWTSLVTSKSRVTPSKPITIPRLELMAAVLSVKMAEFLDEELDYEDINHIFWTDSMVVLGYIANEARRFHVFVANRVQQIRSFSKSSQWHHVDTSENPADLTSRGMAMADILTSDLWWKGPAFLMSTSLPTTEGTFEMSANDPEIKRVVTMATRTDIKDKNTGFLDRLEQFSSWLSARRAIAVCLRLQQRLRSGATRSRTERHDYKPVNVQEMKNAETAIIKEVQAVAFAEEISQLRNPDSHARTLRKDSCLLKLDPFISDDGLLRVGGRIRRASLNYGTTHPVIIPKDCHVARLIVTFFHEKTGHSGPNSSLSETRLLDLERSCTSEVAC